MGRSAARLALPLVLCTIGCASAPKQQTADLVLNLSSPRVTTMVSSVDKSQPVGLVYANDQAAAFYIASDHRADDTTGRAPEKLAVTLPIGGTQRYPLDGVAAGLFYRNDDMGIDLMSFDGYAWWQEEPDGWQIEVNAVSLTDPPVTVRATLSGLFVDHEITGAPLN